MAKDPIVYRHGGQALNQKNEDFMVTFLGSGQVGALFARRGRGK